MVNMSLNPLILAGGKSTRMGKDKHLLQMPDGRPLYQHQIDLLRLACPQSPTIYISIAQDSNLDSFLQNVAQESNLEWNGSFSNYPKIVLIRDLILHDGLESGGPAMGLLAAYDLDPDAIWFVVACDFALLTVEPLKLLLSSYTDPVTCFRNSDGFCEPLLGIWNSEALQKLARNVKNGNTGPNQVIRQLGGRQIAPLPDWEKQLSNINTMDEWNKALVLLKNPKNS